MIVGTRLKDGSIALYDIETNDYKVARNEVLMAVALDDVDVDKTPILALIPGGFKARIIAHRVPTVSQEEPEPAA